MADDKKNIPDAGKVDEPPKPGKVEPAKAAPPVQDQTAPAKADASVVEEMCIRDRPWEMWFCSSNPKTFWTLPIR